MPDRTGQHWLRPHNDGHTRYRVVMTEPDPDGHGDRHIMEVAGGRADGSQTPIREQVLTTHWIQVVSP